MRWLLGMGWIGLFSVSLLDACPIPLPVPGTTDLFLLVLVVRHKSSLWLLCRWPSPVRWPEVFYLVRR